MLSSRGPLNFTLTIKTWTLLYQSIILPSGKNVRKKYEQILNILKARMNAKMIKEWTATTTTAAKIREKEKKKIKQDNPENLGSKKMAQGLRPSTTLAKEMSLSPSSHFWWLLATPGELMPSSVFCGHLDSHEQTQKQVF